ncbi:serine hydrolase domain-containing protein [Microbulbifer halophilus]|uniref:Serine hydrolase domain-containing protein n=1 Tax=Microbulbifer halophilus TaxID=453963 RepID=A0ABW5EGA5_9GAMM|nr:serine hydrolase [Microbulbifer halophilus]MCW8126942.1 serine hydrolase [Microbulbifer halophilus]
MNTQQVSPKLIRDMYSGRQFPDVQAETFRNTDLLFPTRRIARGDSVAPLEHRDVEFPQLQIRSRGCTFDLYDYLSRNRVAGLLVMQDGAILLENYQMGNRDHSRWLSMSVAKSISSTLAGAAIHDGAIDSLDDCLCRYLPQLVGSVYGDVTVAQLLRMCSGVGWNESPTDPDSDRRRMLELQIAQEPGAILGLMASLPRAGEPGSVWNYSTGETHVLGALLRAATGRPLADYLSEKIWSKMGAEADAHWWLESPDGLEVAGSGICATLRDYGRFGLFVANDGVIGGQRVLPEGWFDLAGAPAEVNGEKVNYGFMWWPIPAVGNSPNRGAFGARGLFGQHIMINRREKIVAVVLSARSKPLGAEAIEDNDFFDALVEALV